MYIAKIELKNWKSYKSATFKFPAPSNDKNVVLIGAANGYGKTSLFEAIALGLFGREGLPLCSRADFKSKNALSVAYKELLERSLFRGALSAGQVSCSVTIVLCSHNEESIEIQRTWHFSDKGHYNQNDEDVHVYEGMERSLVVPPTSYGGNNSNWIDEYIEGKLLPSRLANFFLFDGEQVSKMAEQNKKVQIKNGIEGLLGIPVLRSLMESLRSYTRVKQKEFPKDSDKTIMNLPEEIHKLSVKSEEMETHINDKTEKKKVLDDEREILTRDLVGYPQTSAAALGEKFRQKNIHRDAVEKGRSHLEQILKSDLALALSGYELREKVISRLVDEGSLLEWKTSKSQGDSRLEKFLSTVEPEIRTIKPKLDKKQYSGVIECAKHAWECVWNPPPENINQLVLHDYLGDPERNQVVGRLKGIERSEIPEIGDVINEIRKNENSMNRIDQEIAKIESVGPEVQKMQKRLSEVNNEIDGLSREIGVLEKEKISIDSEIISKTADLARIKAKKGEAEPSLRLAASASKVIEVINEIIKKSVPTQIEDIANEMTKAYKFMAHKEDQVSEITIDSSCNVKLLDINGFDMRDFDLSAGEKQIFTQSLIHAISLISEKRFPMVIDTPLGRLDDQHRKGVLRHLVSREHQVILLSTDTEVGNEYLDEVDQYVQKKFLIQQNVVDGIAQSTICEGYFENVRDKK